jgi:hypothetical protein
MWMRTRPGTAPRPPAGGLTVAMVILVLRGPFYATMLGVVIRRQRRH